MECNQEKGDDYSLIHYYSPTLSPGNGQRSFILRLSMAGRHELTIPMGNSKATSLLSGTACGTFSSDVQFGYQSP